MIVAPDGAEEFFRNLAASDKTLKIYPDFGHDVLHEEGHEAAWNDILDWLNKQTSEEK